MSISERRLARLVVAVLALGPGLAALSSCTRLFYHPTDSMYVANPEKLGDIREEVTFESGDGTKLAGWVLPARKSGPRLGTIVQFHGNAQNITSHFQALYWVTSQGYDLFTFDYRGYGISEGKPSPEGLERDALAAVRYAENRFRGQVVLWGQSLGGAVLGRAMDDLTAAERERVRAVVIESSFYSYRAIARDVLSRSWITWWLQPLAGLLVSEAASPEESFARISPIPLLVIHGDADPVVPFRFGQRIFELARAPKELLPIPGGGHINGTHVRQGEYRRPVLEFLDQAPRWRALAEAPKN